MKKIVRPLVAICLLGFASVALAQAPSMADIRATMVQGNVQSCMQVTPATEPSVPKDQQHLQAFCKCTSEGYVNGISDAELGAMLSGTGSAKGAKTATQRLHESVAQCKKKFGY
ncbi:hypothetical protein ACIPF8_13865 [Collimonas sp. NPDC087041]|uniref:hypothetical protein n=1 Tax=Collimonas sp. NPDC087041 TaxID=3363960 RepID=UPI003813E8BB